MQSRRLLSWLFALTLLFGQAAAFAHALSHLHPDDPALPDRTCEVCVAQAQLGAAAPPAAIVVAPAFADATPQTRTATFRTDLAPRLARARAPPAPAGLSS